MDALETIRALNKAIPPAGQSAFAGYGLTVQQTTELWELRSAARSDVPKLLAALDAVLDAVAVPQDAGDVVVMASDVENAIKNALAGD
ncbi:hypothetical protein [Arthrobacter pityocampae]|uniref:hypothetical protein n=1 Tax=Arthrobacter pityocampae TaxID=547334 RepID=UPI003735D005